MKVDHTKANEVLVSIGRILSVRGKHGGTNDVAVITYQDDKIKIQSVAYAGYYVWIRDGIGEREVYHSGNQVELFHPGMWVDYLHGIAQECSAELDRQNAEDAKRQAIEEEKRWGPIDDTSIFEQEAPNADNTP